MPKGQTRFKTFDPTTTVVSVFLPTTTAYRTRGENSRNSRRFHLRKDSHLPRWTRTLNLRLRFVILVFEGEVESAARQGGGCLVFIPRRKPGRNPWKVVTGGGPFGASLRPCTSTQNR